MGTKWEVDADTGDRKLKGCNDQNSDIEEALTGTDQDNWNPTGLATANRIIVNCSSNTDITGITAPASSVNQTILIINIGTANLKLTDEDGSSTAANRIVNNDNKDIELKNGGGVTITYLQDQARWFSLMDKK